MFFEVDYSTEFNIVLFIDLKALLQPAVRVGQGVMRTCRTSVELLGE